MRWYQIKELRDLADEISQQCEDELSRINEHTNCKKCDVEPATDRMDLEVHDGHFWRIQIVWCPKCGDLMSIDKH